MDTTEKLYRQISQREAFNEQKGRERLAEIEGDNLDLEITAVRLAEEMGIESDAGLGKAIDMAIERRQRSVIEEMSLERAKNRN